MNPVEQKRIWEEIWANSNPSTRYAYQMFSQGGKVLEVGCGDLSYNWLDGDYFIGVDISHNALKKAKETLKSRKKSAFLVTASATSLPFKDNSFDLVTSIETITLMGEDFFTALKEMKRVSKDKLILTFTHIDIAKSHNPKKEYIEKEDYFLTTKSETGEKVFFTKENLENILRKLELRIEDIQVLTSCDVFQIATGSSRYEFNSEFPDVCSGIFVEARKKS